MELDNLRFWKFFHCSRGEFVILASPLQGVSSLRPCLSVWRYVPGFLYLFSFSTMFPSAKRLAAQANVISGCLVGKTDVPVGHSVSAKQGAIRTLTSAPLAPIPRDLLADPNHPQHTGIWARDLACTALPSDRESVLCLFSLLWAYPIDVAGERLIAFRKDG